jgi:hypothetical protein
MTESFIHFKVEAFEEDGWWMIRVPVLDLVTQTKLWGEVEEAAKVAIADAMGGGMRPEQVAMKVYVGDRVAIVSRGQ